MKMSIYQFSRTQGKRNKRNYLLSLENSTEDFKTLERLFQSEVLTEKANLECLELKLDFLTNQVTIYSSLNASFSLKSRFIDWLEGNCRMVAFYIDAFEPVVLEFHATDDWVFLSYTDECTDVGDWMSKHRANSPEFQDAWDEARDKM